MAAAALRQGEGVGKPNHAGYHSARHRDIRGQDGVDRRGLPWTGPREGEEH